MFVLSSQPHKQPHAFYAQTTPFAAHLNAGLSVTFAVYVSASVSGGHLNPAVSLAMCTHRRMPWHYFTGYVLAQCVGAFLATALCYGNYDEIIAAWEKSVSDDVYACHTYQQDLHTIASLEP